MKDHAQENNNFPLLENYKEKNIPPVYTQENENESYCNAHFNKDGEIEYYTLEKKTDGYLFWKYKLKENLTKEAAEEFGLWNYKNGMAWVREPVLWLEEIVLNISYGRITLFQGEDGNDYAWYVGEGEKAHLVKREGESCLEIPISNWRITEQAAVAVLENGNVVSADAGRECFVYRPDDGSLITSFQCGWYESICVRGNIIYISAPGGASVQHYNAETQELLPVIEAGVDNSVRIAVQEDKIYQLPLRVKLPVFMTSGQSSEVFSTLESLVEYLETGKDVANIASYAQALQILYYNYTPDIFLPDGTIHREAVEEFLSLVKELCETEQISENSELSKLNYLGGTNAEWWFAAEKSQILFANVRGISWLSYMPGIAKERSGQMSSSNGMFFPNGLLAVNDRSKRKELALQFIKMMFDEK